MPHASPARRRSRHRRSGALVVVALALGSLVGATPFGPGTGTGSAFPGDTVTFEGHGYGHGRGLSQYGALGYALAGWDVGRILDHYYGGTTAGPRPNVPIDVHLRIADAGAGRGSIDGQPLVLDSGQGFTIGSNTFAAGEAARVTRTPGGWRIERGPGCDGPWAEAQAGIDLVQQPTAVVADAAVGDDIDRMIQVCAPGVRRHYRGTVRAVDANGESKAVNRVALEDYLRGVIPRESPASWGDLGGGAGMHQLRAQSVAARTYALAESRGFAKTCDTTSCQAYSGAGVNNARVEDRRSDRAVAETAGQVRLLPSGAVARTEFSSSSGGHTAGGAFPAVRDDGDATPNNPNHTWRTTVPVATVEARFPAVGPLIAIEVTRRNGLNGPHADGGRVLEVVVRGLDGAVVVSGEQLRSRLALKSDWFRVTDPVLTAPAVAMAASPAVDGHLVASRTGEVLAFGAASFHGDAAGTPLNRPIVGVATSPTGGGYWLVATDGGIFSFGDATFSGSTGGIRLNQPIVGMAPTPSGRGYWLVASDGGIFAFGDAVFQGSTGAIRLNQPIVGMAPTESGLGYWLVARDGGVFAFGDAVFRGSTGAIRLNEPIVGMAPTDSGRGYWFVAADGGVFNFGDAPFLGSAGGERLASPVVGMARSHGGAGYRLLRTDGGRMGFGDAGG